MVSTNPANPRGKTRGTYALGDPLPTWEKTWPRIHPANRGKSQYQDLIAQQGGINPPEFTYGHVYRWTDNLGREHQTYSQTVYNSNVSKVYRVPKTTTPRKPISAYALGDPLPNGNLDSGTIHPQGRGTGTLNDLIGQQGGINPPEGTFGHVYTWGDTQGRQHQSFSLKVYINATL